MKLLLVDEVKNVSERFPRHQISCGARLDRVLRHIFTQWMLCGFHGLECDDIEDNSCRDAGADDHDNDQDHDANLRNSNGHRHSLGETSRNQAVSPCLVRMPPAVWIVCWKGGTWWSRTSAPRHNGCSFCPACPPENVIPRRECEEILTSLLVFLSLNPEKLPHKIAIMTVESKFDSKEMVPLAPPGPWSMCN